LSPAAAFILFAVFIFSMNPTGSFSRTSKLLEQKKMATRILFVDDEAGIRTTLKVILEQHGFDVTAAATVPEALEHLNHSTFDVLLSDLNIGQPGDGFTVVSAMRRVQPQAATFILTGYPDFDTALQAIRSQVDDYLIKPADVPTLIHAIEHRLENRKVLPPEKPLKRVSQLMQESLREIMKEWLVLVKAHPELAAIPVNDKDRVDHLPKVVEELASRVNVLSNVSTEKAKKYSAEHGKERARQGYNIPLIVIEMRLLQHVLSSILQRNLIRMDLSSVVDDMMQVGESLQEQLEFSIRGFQKVVREAA
jgi:ActR/RegA family two-component response regulator